MVKINKTFVVNYIPPEPNRINKVSLNKNKILKILTIFVFIKVMKEQKKRSVTGEPSTSSSQQFSSFKDSLALLNK